MRVSSARLWHSFDSYARIGATAAGGVHRPVFSLADAQARQQLIADCRMLDLAVWVDAAANVFASRPGADPTLPFIALGSHLDSVPDGGRYDGPLGVLCGLEVLRTLQEQGITTRHDVVLVSFTGEEAMPFGTSTFGSRALAGRLPDVGDNVLPDGRTVRQALADVGGNWDAILTARLAPGRLACFLEAHIEQGTRLEDAGKPLGVVAGVTGLYRQRVVFRGEAGHAGTTSMAGRRDALRAASRFVLAVATLPQTYAAGAPDTTATVGFLQVAPNSPNVIAGEVVLVTDLRSHDPDLLAALAGASVEAARRAADDEDLRVEVEVMLDQAPVHFDETIRRAMAATVAGLDGSPVEMASLAGHDAVHLQSLAPAGMLFVRCAGGISHHPDESVTREDAALAAEALLQLVLVLDATLQGGDGGADDGA